MPSPLNRTTWKLVKSCNEELKANELSSADCVVHANLTSYFTGHNYKVEHSKPFSAPIIESYFISSTRAALWHESKHIYQFLKHLKTSWYSIDTKKNYLKHFSTIYVVIRQTKKKSDDTIQAQTNYTFIELLNFEEIVIQWLNTDRNGLCINSFNLLMKSKIAISIRVLQEFHFEIMRYANNVSDKHL